jgi:hypothetical protein
MAIPPFEIFFCPLFKDRGISNQTATVSGGGKNRERLL